MGALYALGVGCELGCQPEELEGLARGILEFAGVTSEDLVGIFSIDGRETEPAVVGVAKAFGATLTCFTAAELEEQTSRLLNPSERVFELVGCHGVAESAALAALGPTSRLVVAKTKSTHATAALSVRD